MRPIHYLIGALVMCILLAVTCENRSLRVTNRSLQHRLAQVDSLYHDAAGRYHRTAQTVNRWRDLHRIVADSLNDIAAELRNRDLREAAYIYTIAQLRQDTTDAVITVTDTVWQSFDDIQPVTFGFNLPFRGATVTGQCAFPPPAVTGSIAYEPIPLHIVLSEVGDMYRADIQGPDYLNIQALTATVVHKPKSWLQRNHPWIASIGLLVLWEAIRP